MRSFKSLLISMGALLFVTGCNAYTRQSQADPVLKKQLTDEILDIEKKDQLYHWQQLFGEPDLAIAVSLSKLSMAEYVKHIK